ncbi:MAG: acyl carrier protein [Nocardioides sp.]|nr:acyl carrier protein [Nocardioides sp.]
MTPQDARRTVADALIEIVPDADVDAFPASAPLREELELDSLDFLTFVELLSSRARVRIDEMDYPRLATLDSSVAFLVEQTA